MLEFGSHESLIQLRSVKLRGGEDDTLRARQRLEAALAGLSFSALGLWPRALLIVRRIAQSVRLRLDPVGRADIFGQAVRMDLERGVQRARRPWLHPDAAGAEAVLFADESELMACLVRDWSRGVLAERWWWPAVLRGLPAPEWWRRALLPRGDLLPAVMTLLAPQGVALAWIARLSDDEVVQATAAVTSAYALTALSYSINSSLIWPQARGTGMPSPSSPQETRGASLSAQQHVQQHLIELIPELHVSTLTRAQRRLIAIALGLQRAPSWVRSAEFAIALQLLEAGTVASDTAVIGTVDKSQPRTEAVAKALSRGRRSREGKSRAVDIFHPPHPSLLPGGEGIPLSRHPRTDPGCAPDSLQSPTLEIRDQVIVGNVSKPSSLEGEPIPGARVAEDARNQLEESVFPGAPLLDTRPVGLAVASTLGVGSERAAPLLKGIETQFGGIFYLLNVALALGLYGDFTQPRTPGIALSPWDWLALIGRAWFGRAFQRDAVWELLVKLSGRLIEQPPGRDFVPPDSWSVPPDWLLPWDKADRLRVFATRDRLQVWHEGGFVIIDIPRAIGLAPRAQARTSCDQYEQLREARLVSVRALPSTLPNCYSRRRSLERWMQWLLLYLHARLRRALGDHTPSTLANLVCRHRARIDCSLTAVDVYLSLADLPLPVRIAGLDRDPGWIPAAGRTLAFHFA